MAVGGCCVSSFGRVDLTPSHPFLEEGIPFCGHRGQSARDWNGTGGSQGLHGWSGSSLDWGSVT